jgi:hypothetical protein
LPIPKQVFMETHAFSLETHALNRFDLAQQLAALFVAREHLINAGLIPCPARCQSLAHEIRPFANQFDIEHRRIIGTRNFGARRKGATPSGIRESRELTRINN